MTEHDEVLELLPSELRRLPTPMPPPALVERVRRLAHFELAGRADEKLNRLVLVFLLVFSWTVSLVAFFAVRLLSGERASLLGLAMGSGLSWSAAYFAAAWVSGVALLVLLGLHTRRERRLA
ncbi:MAG: hypothetical protein ACRD21_04725 [Vicinamibacteria bacterium]